MKVNIESTWHTQLASEFDKPYFSTLVAFVKNEYKTQTTYPPAKLIFHAFELCSFNDLKIVILGQDPYHGPRQAHGLSFSVPHGIAMPPSLINIFKEIERDLGNAIPAHGNLENWAKQGVLLLNATLTVKAHQAGSHQNQGWEIFTNAVIQKVASVKKHIVFMLWGAFAKQKSTLIDPTDHLVLQSAHPSPFSFHKGFYGNGHFRKANTYLISQGKTPIMW